MKLKPGPSHAAAASVLAWLVLAGAGSLQAATATNGAFTADLSQGQVDIALRAEPAQVRTDHDLQVTLRVSAPEGMSVTLPDLRDRFRQKVGDFSAGDHLWYAYASQHLLRFGAARDTPTLLRDFLGRPVSIQPLLDAIAAAPPPN